MLRLEVPKFLEKRLKPGKSNAKRGEGGWKNFSLSLRISVQWVSMDGFPYKPIKSFYIYIFMYSLCSIPVNTACNN